MATGMKINYCGIGEKISDELKENQRIFNAQEIAFIRKIVKDEILKASADALAVQFCGERKS